MTPLAPAFSKLASTAQRWGFVGGFLFIVACGDPPREQPTPPSPVEDPRPTESPARVTRVTGSVQVAGRALEVGATVERDAWMISTEDAELVLDLPGGSRVELSGHIEAAMAPSPDEGMWVRSGRVRAIEPARGPGERPPLRLASATATVELEASGEVLVIVAPTRQTFVAALAGGVEVVSHEVDARHRLRTVVLAAGQAVLVGSGLGEPILGDTDRERVGDVAALALLAPPGTPQAGPPAERYAGDMLNRLDEALVWLETEQRRGQDLTIEHRAAVQSGDQTRSMELQRELVAHAQRVYALRRVVTTRWERAELAAPQRSRARRDRVTNLLGF